MNNKISYLNKINQSFINNKDVIESVVVATTEVDLTLSRHNGLNDPIMTMSDVNQNINKILADHYVWVFIGIIIVGGIILNLLTFIGLLRTRCGGLLYIILQITLCDIGLLLIAPLETFYTSHQYWTFPPELCSLYMGVESFAATAIFYFIIACNFHSITTYNLAINEYHRLEKVDEETSSEPTTLFDTDNQDENNDDDDNHDVDSNNDNYEIALRDHKRSLTIDYRKRKYSISVILPVLFIWFLAASVSFPLFMFSTVIPNEKFPKICGIINFNNENNLLMRYLILIVKIVIPTFGLTATMISVGVKLFTRKMEFRKCEIEESVYDILKISFIMSLTFCLLSMQRFYGSLYFEISHKPFTSHKYPTMNALSALVLVFLFYGNSFVRPIIYWVIDGLLWRKVKEILMCKFRKK